MTVFERITESPEVLGKFLACLPVIEGPWDDKFHEQFCTTCPAKNCDACPHATERNNPGWWLSLSAGPDVEQGTVVIDLDPAEAERPLTAEEEAEMERMRPMFRYFISDSEELTESEISEMEATEEEKAVCRFLAKHNPENRVIEVGMLGKTSILLHGAADVETFYNPDSRSKPYSVSQRAVMPRGGCFNLFSCKYCKYVRCASSRVTRRYASTIKVKSYFL